MAYCFTSCLGCIKDIEWAMQQLTTVVIIAKDKYIPKIRWRILPQPEIDNEIKALVEDAKIKLLKANGIEYDLNKRRWLEVKEKLRVKWRKKRIEVWRDMVWKIE